MATLNIDFLNMAAKDFTPDICHKIIYPVYNRGAKDSAFGLKSTLSMIFEFGIDYDNGPALFGKTKSVWYSKQPHPRHDFKTLKL